MTNDVTDIVMILDKSGSMSGLEDDTIGGYNSMLEKQKARGGKCRVTTVLFNESIELVHDRADIPEVKPMTNGDYRAGGMTALIDAMGATMHKFLISDGMDKEEDKANKVIFVIITDGHENSSREYSADKVREMVTNLKKNRGWEFVFLGANIDSVRTATSYGISPALAQDFHCDEIGLKSGFDSLGDALCCFRVTAAMPANWNEKLDEDFKKRKPRKK
ncbi:MAG: VWA domain-containing protein [Deltaproteobacteria bacterium]|jgi:Mg-chelatase subunit ChlD|nr:VWA domain-containing protein [Deltaproteobacteria bacterium]